MPLATARHLSMALGENARKYAIQNFGLDVARMPGDLVIGLLELYMGDGGKSDAVPQAGAVTQAGKGMFGRLCKHGVPMSSHSDSVRGWFSVNCWCSVGNPVQGPASRFPGRVQSCLGAPQPTLEATSAGFTL